MGKRFFDKFGFEMWMKNLAFMQLPAEHLGCWLRLRMLAGTSNDEDGHIPIGEVRKAKVKDVVRFLARGDASKCKYYLEIVNALKATGALEITSSDVVRIGRYEEEQGLGRTLEANRSRDRRLPELEERVAKIRRRLVSYVKADCGPSLDRFIRFIRAEVGCRKPTAEKIVSALEEDQIINVNRRDAVFSVLTFDGKVLAASPLAPPADTEDGTEAGSVVTVRSRPVESESDPDPDSDSYESQQSSSEAGPPVRKLTAGTAPALSEGGASGEAARVGYGRGAPVARNGSLTGGPPGQAGKSERHPYPCDDDPDKYDVWKDDPEECAKYFCPDKDRDTLKVIRSKLKRHGEDVFRQILQEMQSDLREGGWKTMNNHTRVFVSKFKVFARKGHC